MKEPVPPPMPTADPLPPPVPQSEPVAPALPHKTKPETPPLPHSKTRSTSPSGKWILFAALLFLVGTAASIGYFARDEILSTIADLQTSFATDDDHLNVDEQDTVNGVEPEGDLTESTNDATEVAELSTSRIPSSTPYKHSTEILKNLEIPSATVDLDAKTFSTTPTITESVKSETSSGHDKTSPKRDIPFLKKNLPTLENTAKPPTVLSGHSAYVTSVTFSPNGELLASGGNDKTVRLWNTSTRKLLWLDDSFSTNVFLTQFTPAGDRIWACSRNEAVLLEARNGQVVKRHSLRGMVGGRIDYECKRLYAMIGASRFVVLDLKSGRKLDETKRWATAITVKQDDSVIAFGSFENEGNKLFQTLRLPKMQKLYESKEPSRSRTIAMAFSPNGRFLIHATGPPRKGLPDSPTVRLFDMSSGREAKNYKSVKSWQWGVAFSNDSRLVAMGGGGSLDDWFGHKQADRSIQVWNVSTGRMLKRFSGHNAAVLSVSFSPDGKSLASGSADKTIRFWNLED